MFELLPVFGRCRSVSLASVLEPVAHLCGGEACGLSQVPLAGWVWVWVLQVPLSQQTARPFLGNTERMLGKAGVPEYCRVLSHLSTVRCLVHFKLDLVKVNQCKVEFTTGSF